MKCMKDVNGKVIRVTDERAEQIKHEGYTFCPKSEWKQEKNNVEETPLQPVG